MGSNKGRFIDRSPLICAAGKITTDSNNAANTFKEYNIEDKITALKHDANIWHEDRFEPPLKLPNFKQPAFFGRNTEISKVLNPPLETRYQTLLQDLRETTYDSLWNKEIGKVRDPVPGLPKGMIPTTVTFGKPSVKETSVKELINPSKTPYEVLWESQVGHDYYKKTHNDYNAGEQLLRGYLSPPFDEKACFGKKTNFDYRGICVKCCCQWHIQKPITYASRIQADLIDKWKPVLGKSLAPNRNITCVPKNHAFGDRYVRDQYGVQDLMKDASIEPCLFKRDFFIWVRMWNKLRSKTKELVREGRFNFPEFYKKLLHFDKEKVGRLPKDKFYELCLNSHINFSLADMEPLLKLLNVIEGDQIDYTLFVNMINVNAPPIELMSVKDIPPDKLYYITTSQASSCDFLFINNAEMRSSGIPTCRTDLSAPQTPPGSCLADIENLGDSTNIKTLLNPSIYANYGLSYRDFFLPRQPEMLRALFEKIGYSFSENNFEKIWKEGVEQDGTGLVCVDTFKKILQKYSHRQKIQVDEADC
ncbi:EF-hand domain-containing family member B-like [Diorhabda carinulata]|uniref:EF-hand domain-containing family member B-like n=1 Tax=Diorhabda carinulata TaxID=1163345 RepID=UPI0025A25965|nr:EF-hand domain-containing family member B-like [Diorhabda carinulata]